MPQLGVASVGLSSSGPIKSYRKSSDEGNELTFSFCGDCGAQLFKSTSKMRDTLFVFPGALLKVPEVSLERRVFEGSRQNWDQS